MLGNDVILGGTWAVCCRRASTHTALSKGGHHAVAAGERLHDEHFGDAARSVGCVVVVDRVDDE